jgi:hypothetical protein
MRRRDGQVSRGRSATNRRGYTTREAALSNGKRRHASQGIAEAAIRSLLRRGLARPEAGALHSLSQEGQFIGFGNRTK